MSLPPPSYADVTRTDSLSGFGDPSTIELGGISTTFAAPIGEEKQSTMLNALSGDMVQINVTFLAKHQPITLEMIPDLQISVLKIEIEARVRLSIWDQIIMFNGRQLHDDSTIRDCGLTNGVEVFCITPQQELLFMTNPTQIQCSNCGVPIMIALDVIEFLCPRCRTYHRRPPKQWQNVPQHANPPHPGGMDPALMGEPPLPMPTLERVTTMNRQLTEDERKRREQLAVQQRETALNYPDGHKSFCLRSFCIGCIPIVNLIWGCFRLCLSEPGRQHAWHDTNTAKTGLSLGLFLSLVSYGVLIILGFVFADGIPLMDIITVAGIILGVQLILVCICWDLRACDRGRGRTDGLGYAAAGAAGGFYICLLCDGCDCRDVCRARCVTCCRNAQRNCNGVNCNGNDCCECTCFGDNCCCNDDEFILDCGECDCVIADLSCDCDACDC